MEPVKKASKPVKMMKCEHCGDEIERKMCTQKYCYKCNGEVNRGRRGSLQRVKRKKISDSK